MTDDVMRRVKDYWSIRANGYSQTVERQIDGGSYHRWLGTVERHLGSGKGLSVLDVGTGPGFFPVILGKRGHHVIGIDCTDAMLEQARANCARYNADAEFANMSADCLDFPDGAFDLVVSRNLVWNLKRPEEAYCEWLRILRPGGKIMIFDGNHYLYLFDEEYRKAQADREHPPVDAVDPKIMEDIAKGLPLSSVRRPDWDVRILSGLGAQNVIAEPFCDGHSATGRNRKSVANGFFVCATRRCRG